MTQSSLPAGKNKRFIVETATAAGSKSQFFTSDTDSLEINFYATSISGSITVSIYNFIGDLSETKRKLIGTLGPFTSDNIDTLYSVAINSTTSQIFIEATYTDACSYEVWGRGRQTVSSLRDVISDTQLGLVVNASTINKFGKSTAVNTTRIPVWTGNTAYTFLTSADTMDVTSADADDQDGDTGAHKVIIEGLDSNYEEVSEEVTLGVSGATTTQQFLRVFRARVTEAGSSATNEGRITIATNTGATVQAYIEAGEGQTEMCIYTVPAGKTGLLRKYFASAETTKSVEIQLRTRNVNTNVFNTKHLFQITGQPYDYTFSIPLNIPEKTDVVLTAQSLSGAAGQVSGSFAIFMVNN